ncbi:MAG: hypothetical protein IIB62_10860 [Proteobacteria bacterium]|nr:hypothetical protein [Pseudomonadota bacterium]
MAKFKKGKSGNPSGRPKGARNRLAVTVDELMQEDAAEIIKVALEKAKGGDAAFVRIVIDRILPPAKDRPVTFDLPEIKTADDAGAASGAILQAVSNGEVTPGEAGDLVRLLDSFSSTLVATDMERRIAALENR